MASKTASTTTPVFTATGTPVAATTTATARPGATFPIGETAAVAYTDQSDSGVTIGTDRVRVTVLSIRKGTLADFNGIQLDASQQASTPDYVEVKLTNLGPAALNTNDSNDPAVAIDGVDNTGQTQQSITFLGTFPRCPDANTPTPFSPSKSFQTCLTFLVPGGISKVAWLGTDDYDTSPVTWGGK